MRDGFKNQPRADEMAQWVKLFLAKPDDLSSVPSAHMEEGEKLTPVSYPLTSTCVMAFMYVKHKSQKNRSMCLLMIMSL